MTTNMRPSGLRVVELGGGIAAAYGARLLADFGADVIKVEPPGGDPARRAGPFPGNVPHPEKSGLFLYLNANKRGVTLDITTATGAARLAELLADADLLIENLGAGRLDRVPFPVPLPDRLVICSISPYGQDGPRSGELASELGVYAAGGMMYTTGDGNREPVKHGLHQAAHLAGVNAAAAALAAVMLARRTGRDQRIDISMQETVAQTIFPALNIYSHTGGVMTRAPMGLNRLVSSSPMPARDGWIMPSYAGFGEWEALAAFLEMPELADERFLTPAGRQTHGAEIDDLVAPKFASMSKHDIFHDGQEWRFTFTAVQTAHDLDRCPHLAARSFFIEQPHPVAGSVRMPGMVPFASDIARTPVRPAPGLTSSSIAWEEEDQDGALAPRLTPAPSIHAAGPGRRNLDVAVRDRGAGPRDSGVATIRAGTGPELPLSGVRILELGMVFVLPLAITPLAALGADVIKVEAAARPDSVRWGPPPDNMPREDGYNHGAHFQMLNRNKRGITLDLTTPRGRELLLQLVEVSDVVAENFTPRVLRNLDLTYDTLAAVNPRIIVLSSTGFGQTGPWQHYRAYGPNTESVDGLMHLTGYPDGPPVRGGAGGLGVAFTDVAGAYFGSYAVLAALEYRERTGRGQWLDLSHYEAGVATIPEAVLDYTMNGQVRGRVANRHPWRAPQGVYPCAGNERVNRDSPDSKVRTQDSADRWIAVSVASDEQFTALVSAIGLPGLSADPRFATMGARRAHHDALDELIGDATRGWPMVELARTLQRAGVEATAVATPRDVWLDPQLRHRGYFEMVPPPASAPEIGPRPHLRPGWKFSHTPSVTRSRAPEFGEHNDEVLSGLLGLPPAELTRLEADGVIARAPRPGLLARPGPMDLETMVRTKRLREVDPEYRERLCDLD